VTKVSLKSSTTSVVTKVGKSLQITIPTVGTKSVLVKVSVKDPAGATYTVASTAVAKYKAYEAPTVKFSKPGNYVVTVFLGTAKKILTVKVSK